MSIRKDHPLGDVRYVANTDDGILIAKAGMSFLLCGPSLEKPVPTIRDVASGKTMMLKGFEPGDFEAYADLRRAVLGQRRARRTGVRRVAVVLGVFLVAAAGFALGRSAPERIPGLDVLTYEAAETAPAPGLNELEAFLRYLADNSSMPDPEGDVPVGGTVEIDPAATEGATSTAMPAAGEIFETPEFLRPAPAVSPSTTTSAEDAAAGDDAAAVEAQSDPEPANAGIGEIPSADPETAPPETERTSDAVPGPNTLPEINGEADLARILAEGEAIPAEMLIDVPHEVASVLRRAGAVSDDAPDGVPYSIIRLSPQTMERYTGRDGIPTIPHSNSWVATGNSVSLPLPGGGDIKSEEDFAAFGLNP